MGEPLDLDACVARSMFGSDPDVVALVAEVRRLRGRELEHLNLLLGEISVREALRSLLAVCQSSSVYGFNAEVFALAIDDAAKALAEVDG